MLSCLWCGDSGFSGSLSTPAFSVHGEVFHFVFLVHGANDHVGDCYKEELSWEFCTREEPRLVYMHGTLRQDERWNIHRRVFRLVLPKRTGPAHHGRCTQMLLYLRIRIEDVCEDPSKEETSRRQLVSVCKALAMPRLLVVGALFRSRVCTSSLLCALDGTEK